MQLSLKMEPSTLGAGEAMADSDMVISYMTELALIIIVLYTGMYMYMYMCIYSNIIQSSPLSKMIVFFFWYNFRKC